VFIVVVYLVIDSVRKLLDTASYAVGVQVIGQRFVNHSLGS